MEENGGRSETGKTGWEVVNKERILEMLGVKSRTPRYMIREEIKREKMRNRAGRGAWDFEKRAREFGGEELIRECRREIRKRIGRGRELSEWEIEGELF